MTLPSSFVNLALKNRLGQTIQLAVHHIQAFGREYIFVAAVNRQTSSLVAKNAEHFAFQLREFFRMDTRRFEMIEVRGDIAVPSLWRWRFQWVGASPISPRCEVIDSVNQQNQLLGLLRFSEASCVAVAG